MSRRIKCGEPDPDGEYGCEVMHQVISMDFETIERLTTELELAQLQLHSIRKLAIDWIQGVGEPRHGVILNAIFQHADGKAEPMTPVTRIRSGD